jgi:hypothetical protein
MDPSRSVASAPIPAAVPLRRSPLKRLPSSAEGGIYITRLQGGGTMKALRSLYQKGREFDVFVLICSFALWVRLEDHLIGRYVIELRR